MVASPTVTPPVIDLPEPSRARYPDVAAIVERSGGRIAYEVYGSGDPTIVFMPPWSIVHSRIWKAQIPDFARRHRVIAWDARGNGRSDRPRDPEAYGDASMAADLAAVLDATGTRSAVLVGLSGAAVTAVITANEHPERVLGLVLIGPTVPLITTRARASAGFDTITDDEEGWARHNIHFWRRDFGAYLEFFFGQAFPEAHSTKAIEDAIGYGRSTDPETLGASIYGPGPATSDFRAYCRSIHCPTLIIHGDGDRIVDISRGLALSRCIPDAEFVRLHDSGHCPNVRDPVRINLLLRDFLRRHGWAA